MDSNISDKLYTPIITPISTDAQQIIFGVTFSNPINKLTLFKQHLYSLFLLLYYYGQQAHKKYIRQRINGIIEMLEQKLVLKRKTSNQSSNARGEYLDIKMAQAQIKVLQFTEQQLAKNMNGREVQLHTFEQRQYIRKAFIAIFEKNKTLADQVQMNFVGIAKLACTLLGIDYSAQNYYGCYIIRFTCKAFTQEQIMVYIQIDKERQTYSYIKQKLARQNRSKFQQNLSCERGLGFDNSFQMIIRLETSYYGNQSIMSGPQAQSQTFNADNNGQLLPHQIEQSGQLDESSILEDLEEEKPKYFIKRRLEQQKFQQQSQVQQSQNSKPHQDQEELESRGQQIYQQQQQSQILDHNQNINKITQVPPMQNTKQSEESYKNYPQIQSKIPQKLQKYMENKQVKYDNELQSSRNAKSAYIQSPKIKRKRKTSDTFLQNLKSNDNYSFQTFVKCINDQNIKVQTANIFQQDIMLQSKTTRIIFDNQGLIDTSQYEKQTKQNVQKIVNLVKSGVNYSPKQIFNNYGLKQIVEAWDMLQNQLKNDNEQEENFKLKKSDKTEEGPADYITILIGIMKQQKQKNIMKFIQEARQRVNLIKKEKNLQVKNQRLGQAQVRRGQQMVKFSQKQYNGQLKKSKFHSKILRTKGIDIFSSKLGNKQQANLTASKILNFSTQGNANQLFIKASQIFSPFLIKNIPLDQSRHEQWPNK